MGEKVVLGMSGGVDSATSARILKDAGYEVTGLFLAYKGADTGPAERAAEELSLELVIKDITDELEEKVICPFIESYQKGYTPNPCIICNPSVKFRTLIEEADRRGAEYVATGHYARTVNGRLFASDSPKDQSYMLYRLPPSVIERCIFPLGEMENKDQVRAIAEKAGLSSSRAPDSMEICFIPTGDHADFMESRGCSGAQGWFVDEDGNRLARHGGIHRYTVGQRRGLGVAASGRLYVSNIDPVGGDVTLSLIDPVREIACISDVVMTSPEFQGMEGIPCKVRVRHSRNFFPGRFYPSERKIIFDKPVRALSPGQSAVCYTAEGQVIGGGFLTRENLPQPVEE